MKTGDPKSVEEIFNVIAPRYDFLNDLLSFGLHRLWKKKLLSTLNPSPGEFWIDLCCGTGDITFRLAEKVKPTGKVIGIDSAQIPLEIARKRTLGKPKLPLEFVHGDALNTNLSLNSYDGIVMAYGLRNLCDPLQGLKEIRRLLKRGGRAGILDFNLMPDSSIGDIFQKFYIRNIVVPVASIYKLKKHYAYLENSLENFLSGPEQEELAKKAGFSSAKHRPIGFGQMGILIIKS